MTATRTSTTVTRVTRQDIENKLRQIRGDVDTAGEAAKGVGSLAAGAAAVAMVVVVYVLGKRRGRRSSTVVEVKRF